MVGEIETMYDEDLKRGPGESQIAVPASARARIHELYSNYQSAVQAMTLYLNGLITGMGLNPEEWELNTSSMMLFRQGKIERNGHAS